eukprot:CAMPEP_0170816702 /NCGR_PEP_ID=MMETSP0733-20121128/39499_1 /TAXON_ID=186038 /ORGANISM="Fragilariopsis kerguelensis, Strain L26-C5" /LENGTH=36 /DNA_ID= /DNA_START= /DNA_END= /DNA_ORIENTATION=
MAGLAGGRKALVNDSVKNGKKTKMSGRQRDNEGMLN